MTTIDEQAMAVEPRAQPPVHRPLAGYLPIAEHGVVGDLHSAALVGTDGTIDWYCPERFDAPAVFAGILDRHRGGFYRIAPARADAQPKQLYLEYRYDPHAAPDGLDGDEATFSVCTFWYVEFLARAGRLEEAQLAFETMLTYANHLGLYSEQIGRNGELLGNFPQAFTHLGLISAAISLDRELSLQSTCPVRREAPQITRF